jgi:hypothetical protein
MTKGGAKVQIGAELLCKSGRSEYRVWSIEYRLVEGTSNRGPEDSRCIEVGTAPRAVLAGVA